MQPRFIPAIIFLLILFTVKKGNTQTGCTDPQAENYNPNAVENDGSCTYSTTNYSPICLSKLPEELPECSCIEYFENQLYAGNDSGDGPLFFQIDTTDGSLLRSIWIENADNRDYEDFAASKEHFFIGDFGNNAGARKDLKILKIKKSDLTEDSVTAEAIEFSYADQTDFTPRNMDNDFDAEAFFYHNDSLYIFSKNWADKKTRLYVCPDQPGNYSLNPVAEFDVEGLVTSADISPDGKNIMLLCYTETAGVFMWLLFDYQDFKPFSGNKRKIRMGTVLTRGQVEAITFQNENSGFIGSENISFVDGKLMHFKISQWIENPNTDTRPVADRSLFHFYPNPFHDELLVDVKSGAVKVKKVEIFDRTGRRVLKKRTGLKNRIRINGNKLPAGAYVLKVTLKGGISRSERIVKL